MDMVRGPGTEALFLALRAWATGQRRVDDVVEDWLCQPWVYTSQITYLYTKLVKDLRLYFREPRPERKMCFPGAGFFNFRGHAHI